MKQNHFVNTVVDLFCAGWLICLAANGRCNEPWFVWIMLYLAFWQIWVAGRESML